MQVNTNISNVIEANANKDRYDAEVKKILSDKTVLAWIMQESVREFHGYPIETIRECIEGEPDTATRRVLPGHTPEGITGMGTEDSVPGEGSITYDIRFHAAVPDGGHIRLIINVEAQKSLCPGYDIVTRAVFYCARMLSAQCGTEFTPKDYGGIKKVYSIWICMDVPRKAEYTISRYRMAKEDVHGHADISTRYDLLEVVMVYLGKTGRLSRGTKLHGLLGTLLAGDLKPWEKKDILEREYGIPASVELEGGLNRMCNLSELVEENGIKKGMKKGMKEGAIRTLLSLVEKGRLTPEEAAEEAGMSADEFRKLPRREQGPDGAKA